MNIYPKHPAPPVPKKQVDIENEGQKIIRNRKESQGMTVTKINEMGLIDDSTEIVIRQGEGFNTLARGNWYQDDILAYEDHEIESFTWQDDNRIYIDVKM